MVRFDKRKIAAINSLRVVDFSCSGGECEYVAVDDTTENRQRLLDAGFTAEQLDSEEVRDGFDGVFDVAFLAFQCAGAGWYTAYRGFSRPLPESMQTKPQARALLHVYESEYVNEIGIDSRSTGVCERNGWLMRVSVDTGLRRASGPIIEHFWRITEQGIDALWRYGEGGRDEWWRRRVRESLDAQAVV